MFSHFAKAGQNLTHWESVTLKIKERDIYLVLQADYWEVNLNL